MNESLKILFPIFFPIVMGLLLLCGQTPKRGRTMTLYTGCVLIITALSVLGLVTGPEVSFTLFYLTGRLPVYFHLDSMGKIFAAVVSVVWVLAGFFSFEYMKKGKEQKRFFGFYLMVYGILMALDFAGNLITFYIFYEMMTLLSMPLVLHERTKEAIMAGLKYLFYSFCGAYMVLFGLYFVYRY
ncbi:MAG: proton-conducting membrane transporter, partial [Lachnospiraceae bacterium]|nr:proton-conducting membrane transporter [Lachnospiraceae bacterium]